ncbi:MAG: FtsW/RodA/SpoVE family cell cycle protein [Kiritimatiellia bacterium]|nr:FtsW/RodA/SpoVE family cell cycle protein [Kiritimatiellia bacterium]
MPNGFKWLGLLAPTFLAGYLSMLKIMPHIEDSGWFMPAAIYLASATLVGALLSLFRFKGDWPIVWGTLLLTGIGTIVQTRTGTTIPSWDDWVPWWPMLMGIGAFALAAITFKPGRSVVLSKLGIPSYLFACAVLGAMLLCGQRYRGGLYLAGNLNPVEIVKPLLAIFLAAYLSPSLSKLRLSRLLILWGMVNLLLFLSRDMGLVMLLNLLFIVALSTATRQPLWLLLGALGLLVSAWAIPHLLPHAAVRFSVWRNPFADSLGKGWQPLQALCALYSGGLFGSGIGGGEIHHVPIVTSDFVYAALAEEIGLIGTLAILLIYLALATRAFRLTPPRPFENLLASNLATLFIGQALINIGGVVKAIPVTGITLPLISHGGSSLVVTLLSMGLIAAISDHSDK